LKQTTVIQFTCRTGRKLVITMKNINKLDPKQKVWNYRRIVQLFH